MALKNSDKPTYEAKRPKFLEKTHENTKAKNAKNVLNGSPRAHFEHSGLETGSKKHAGHHGHSEIISS